MNMLHTAVESHKGKRKPQHGSCSEHTANKRRAGEVGMEMDIVNYNRKMSLEILTKKRVFYIGKQTLKYNITSV